MYPFIYDETQFKGLPRAAFLKALSAEGVPAGTGYPNNPIYTQEFINQMFQTAVYKKFYSSAELNFDAYKQKNHCPNLIKTFQTSVWISSQGILLGSRSDMDDIVRAVEKIHKNADKLKKA